MRSLLAQRAGFAALILSVSWAMAWAAHPLDVELSTFAPAHNENEIERNRRTPSAFELDRAKAALDAWSDSKDPAAADRARNAVPLTRAHILDPLTLPSRPTWVQTECHALRISQPVATATIALILSLLLVAVSFALPGPTEFRQASTQSAL